MVSFFIMSTTRSWHYVLAAGIIAILSGALMLLDPGLTLRLSLYFVGAVALVVALVMFLIAFSSGKGGSATALALASGVLFLIVAFTAFFRPAIIGGFLTVIAAAVLIIAGLGIASAGLFGGGQVLQRVIAIPGGAILAVLGLLLIYHGDITVILIVRLLGLLVLGAGILSLAWAFILRIRGRNNRPQYIDTPTVEK